MEELILLRYGEIHLKGLNRPFFERKLTDAIKAAAKSVTPVWVEHSQGRYYISPYDTVKSEQLIGVLRRVFGVHSVSPAVAVEKDIETIRDTALAMIRRYYPQGGSFKVEARRADKRFPMDSMQINSDVGEHILESGDAYSVDVHDPQIRVYVEIRDRAYIYTQILDGPGGMPTGSSGGAMLLLSGGIDSPVAGYMMMRRGVELKAVYFHSPPHTTELAKRKVQKLAAILSSYGCKLTLYSVSFTKIQETIYDTCDEGYLTILTRRFMMRIAEMLAQDSGCDCLVTGENLGQVASQTMQALNTTNTVVRSMPVFRPLIAFDKRDIMDVAAKIGTYDVSIEPYEDCCTVFVPRHPVTKPKLANVEKEEAKLDVDALIDDAMLSLTTEVIGED